MPQLADDAPRIGEERLEGDFRRAVAGWLAYGVIKSDLAIAVTNAITFALVITLVVLKAAQRRGRARSCSA